MTTVATQPAIVHPPTGAALERARAGAMRNVTIGAPVTLVAFVVLLVAVGRAQDEDGSGPGTIAAITAMLVVVVGLLVTVEAGLRLRRVGFVRRVLGAEPWHVVGRHRWIVRSFGPPQARRRETMVAVRRPEGHVVKGRLVGLKPGWTVATDGQAEQGWLAGPVDERYVLGTVDGLGLALVKEPTGLRQAELGTYLATLEP